MAHLRDARNFGITAVTVAPGSGGGILTETLNGFVAFTRRDWTWEIVNLAVPSWSHPTAIILMQDLLRRTVYDPETSNESLTCALPEVNVPACCVMRDSGFEITDQQAGWITFQYRRPTDKELVLISGVVCRRRTGWPCLLPGTIIESK
jgi:hypothetical protein